jgi:hypothetical protein
MSELKDVTLTPHAARLLLELARTPAERKKLDNATKRVALGQGSNVARPEHVRLAYGVADEAFLPEPGEFAKGEGDG